MYMGNKSDSDVMHNVHGSWTFCMDYGLRSWTPLKLCDLTKISQSTFEF